MKSKLRRELQQFLEQERISFNSGIVNYITYQLADIKVTEEQLNQGFSFEKEETIEEKISFSIATGLDFSQIKKILHFFKIPEEKYQHGKPILLNNDHIFAYFIFHFKNCFQNLKETSPEIIAQYKALSAPILEENAKSKLKKHLEEVKRMIMTHYQNTPLTNTIKDLIGFISILSGRLYDLENFPHLYGDIINSNREINHFLQQKEICSNKELSAQLIMMLESVTLFTRYHRNESILSNIVLHKEFKEFLIPHRINPEKCNLLGHMMLSLADVNVPSEILLHLAIGNDRARIVMTYKNISQENINKIIENMRHLGDETAFELITKKQNEHEETNPYHCIEVDGQFFHRCVLPRIKENITQMALQHQLSSYQEASKEDFPSPRETTRVSEYSIFEKFSSSGQLDTFNKKSSRSCICTMLN